MFIWHINPVLFTVGPFQLTWYALMYVAAYVVCTYFILPKVFRGGQQPLHYIGDFVFVAIGSGMLLGRFVKALMYGQMNWRALFFPIYCTPNLSCRLHGFSTRGALVGGLLGTYLYAHYRLIQQPFFPFIKLKRDKYSSLSFKWLTTPFAFGLLTFVSFVRIGNFINAEVIGTRTQRAYGVFFARPVAQKLLLCDPRIRTVSFHIPYQADSVDEVHVKLGLQQTLNKEEAAAIITKVGRAAKYKNVAQHITLIQTLTTHGSEKSVHCIIFKGKAHLRHAVQLYESLLGFLILLLSLGWWCHQRVKPRNGLMGAALLAITQLLRFGTEFYKEKISIGFQIGNYQVCKSQCYSGLGALVGIFFFVYLYYRDSGGQVKTPNYFEK